MGDQWFVLPINPEPWAIGPVGYARRDGRMSAYVGRNTQLAAFQEAVKESIKSQSPIMHEGHVELTIYFWRRRSEYTTPQARTHRKHEADATNMLKATEDALQGILFNNDRDNRAVSAVVMDQDAEVQPCIVIHTSGWVGIDPSEIPNDVWLEIDRAQTQTGLEQADDNIWRGPSA